MAIQLIADMYGCKTNVLDDSDRIAEISHEVIASIGASVIEECAHKFEPIGVSYVAVISTSHFSVHTWPEYGYAAVDVFSCSDDVPSRIAEALKEAFCATEAKVRTIERSIIATPNGKAEASE